MWMTFPLTAAGRPVHIRRDMHDGPKLAGLTDAKDHLWQARHELLAAGYESWLGNLIELIDAVVLEIEWLSTEEREPGATA
jgi:hypothetical protein